MVGDFNWDPQEITRTAYMSDIVNGAFCHCFNLGKTHKDGRVIDHVSYGIILSRAFSKSHLVQGVRQTRESGY